MEPLETGPIYSIEVGEPKNGFKYNIGQRFKIKNDYVEIVEIVRDDNCYLLFGTLRYVIYVRKVGSTEEFCWKYYENTPIQVTCYFED